jgi:hypothetical protein
VEYSQKGDLWEVGKDEEDQQDDGGEDGSGQ